MKIQSLQVFTQILIALGILVTALGGYGVYHYQKKNIRHKRKQKISQLTIFSGLLISAIGTYGAFHYAKKIEEKGKEKTTNEGKLTPVPKILFSSKEKIYSEFEFGNSGAILLSNSNSPLFKIGQDNSLLITNGEEGLKVSIILYNKGGKIAVELIENEWKVNPLNTWDRNYIKNALEVKDDTGDIILQIVLKGNRVCFQGKIYDKFGGGVGLGEAPPEVGKGGMIYQSIAQMSNFKINPIFKYPSTSHLGELINK